MPDVARPAVSGKREQWAEVGRLVRERRFELKLTGRDVEDAGVSRSVLSLIENVRQDRYETRILRNLCERLGWTPDSIEQILAGGAPVSLNGSSPLTEGTAAHGVIDVRGLPPEDVELIERQVRHLKRLHGVED